MGVPAEDERTSSYDHAWLAREKSCGYIAQCYSSLLQIT